MRRKIKCQVITAGWKPSALGIPCICLLLQQCLHETDLGTTPSSSLQRPSQPPSQSQPPGLSLLSRPLPLGLTNAVFVVSSLLSINLELLNSSELSHHSGGCRQLPSQPTSAGLLHLPFSGLLFSLQGYGSGGHGPLLLPGGAGEAWGCPVSLADAKPGRRLPSPPGHADALPRWVGESPACTETAVALEKNWTRPFGLDISMTWTLPAQTSISMISWRITS